MFARKFLPFLLFLNIFLINHLVSGQIKLKKGAPHVLLSNPKQILAGKVESSRGGAPYYAFNGVRYAKPPKRFQHPEPLEQESNTVRTIEAFKFGSSCARWSRYLKKYSGSEDCLFLNVYVPMKPSLQKNGPKTLPVMLYIHGGAFVDGESDTLGPDYFMDENVILVVINYRLGALGFLSTQDSVVPGNMGLHDQHLAIKWVHENANNFGGDRNRITIFGESAGGASVNLQMLYPSNQGLFSRAISQSGTAHCHWVIHHPKQVLKNFQKLSKLVGCDSDGNLSNELVVKCLNEKPWEEILDAQNKTQKWFPGLSIPFGPIIELDGSGSKNKPSFLTQDPEYLMAAGKFINVPYIVGFNEEEGYWIYSEVILKNGKLKDLLNNNFNQITPDLFHIENYLMKSSDADSISEKIQSFYFGDDHDLIKESNRKGLVDLSSDTFFNVGVRNTAKIMAKHGAKVYAYVFSYKGEHTLVSSLLKENKVVVSHADELQYLFNSKRHSPKGGFKKDSESERISKYFVKLWTSFAEHGSTEKATWRNLNTTNWTSGVKEKELVWMELNSKIKMQAGFHQDRFDFWDLMGNEYLRNYEDISGVDMDFEQNEVKQDDKQKVEL